MLSLQYNKQETGICGLTEGDTLLWHSQQRPAPVSKGASGAVSGGGDGEAAKPDREKPRVTLAVPPTPSDNNNESATLDSTGASTLSTLGASLASLAPSTPFPVATPPPLAQGPFRPGGLSQQTSFVSDSFDANNDANALVSPNIHADSAAAATATPGSTQPATTAAPPASVSTSSLAPASTRAAASVRTPKTPNTPKSSTSASQSQCTLPRKITTHPAVPALFHGPAEEEWERRGRANARPPQVLQDEAAWREYTPRGIILSAYKALPPQRAPWRPASQPVPAYLARARTAEATARGHQLSLDLEVDEPPPDHIAAYNHVDSFSSVGGLGAGHNEVAWRSAHQPKVGLPGKAPWRPSNPPTDLVDLGMRGTEALARGVYVSPDLLSMGPQPGTVLVADYAMEGEALLGVEPGGIHDKAVRRYNDWKRKGPDSQKAWRPSSTPTSNRDAKIVGASANATGHYISMDLTSYGRVPGKGIKPHGRALGVAYKTHAALAARAGSPGGLPAQRPMHQQHDLGFKRKGPDDVPFVQRVHAAKATHKNKIGLVTDQFVS